MARRRISERDGQHALDAVLANPEAPRPTLAMAVRFLLEELAERHPGGTVEVRVPPFGAVQCVEGPNHTRGTPPNVIETDAQTWIELATGALSWLEALQTHRVLASGARATLEDVLPLLTRP